MYRKFKITLSFTSGEPEREVVHIFTGESDKSVTADEFSALITPCVGLSVLSCSPEAAQYLQEYILDEWDDVANTFVIGLEEEIA